MMTDMKLWLMRVGFALPFGAMGLYLVTVAVRLFARQREWRSRAITAEGKIVGFEQERSSSTKDQRPYFAPVVTFTAANGQSIQFKSSTSVRPNPYTIGQQVAVRYLPENPEGADLESSASSWLPLIAVIVLAAVALTAATLPFVLKPPAPR